MACSIGPNCLPSCCANPWLECDVISGDIYGNLRFSYDDLKELVLRSLQAERPLHLLLVGPPASGKSILLSEIDRLPRSRFALGGSSSKAGITQLLAEQRPRYLIIDEIDKANSEDLSTLLSLMESGPVSTTKGNRQE